MIGVTEQGSDLLKHLNMNGVVLHQEQLGLLIMSSLVIPAHGCVLVMVTVLMEHVG